LLKWQIDWVVVRVSRSTHERSRDSELNFVQHPKEQINIAYSYLGIIKRNFIYLDEDAFVMLYKSLVRSYLEYADLVWSPHRLGLIEDVEKI